jgi:hypothetical protein
MDRRSGRGAGATGGAGAPPVGELLAARAALLAAGQRLRRLTAGTITGREYDPDAFDAAVLELRRAQERARAVRAAWLRRQALRPAQGTAAA